MRSTTKVNVAGKDTTAGEAGGEKKEKPQSKIDKRIAAMQAQGDFGEKGAEPTAGEAGGKKKEKPLSQAQKNVKKYPSMQDAESIMDQFQEDGLEKGVDYEETTAYGDDVPNEIVALSDKAKKIVNQYDDEDEDSGDEGRSNDGAYTFDKGDAKIDYDKEWEKRKARIKSTPDIKSGDSLGKTSSGKDMVVYKNNKAFFEDTKDYTLEDHQEALKALTDMPHHNHINVQNQFKHEDAVDRLGNSPLHQFKEVSKQADKLRSSIKRREEDFLNFGYTDKQEAKAKADKKKLKMMDKQVDKLQKKHYKALEKGL